MAAGAPAAEPLLREFLVVGLQAAAGGRLQPTVKYHFSTSGGGASRGQLLKTCVNFCFPVIDESGKTPWPASESFTYTLTEDDGTRLFGFCRRLLQPPSTLPDAICILTKLQWSSFYAHMLDIVQLHFDLAAFVPPFIQAVARTPPPRPGTSCVVSPWGERGESFRLFAPDESMPPVASFELLFTALGTVNVLRLVAALLHESRVIIIASKLADISTIAHCVMALLQPFTWQHVFIPVLPTSMIDYVCAPMPFVAGVLEAHRGLLLQQPMDRCVFVEVERGGKVRGDDNVPQLPRPYRDTLFRRLEGLKVARNGYRRYDPRLVTDAFLNFFAEVLCDYREHVNEAAVRAFREQVGAAERAGKRGPRVPLDELFDHNAFVEGQQRELQPFLLSLRGVQMWEGWLTETLLTPDEKRTASPFERRMADAAARLATMPGPLDGKAKVSGKERAREAVVGLRFALASAGPPSLARPPSGAGGGGGGGGGKPSTSPSARAEQVAAAVGHARAAGAVHLQAAQARARTVATNLRERSAHLGAMRRPASASQLSAAFDADEMLAGVVLQSHDGGGVQAGGAGGGCGGSGGQVGGGGPASMQPLAQPTPQRLVPPLAGLAAAGGALIATGAGAPAKAAGDCGGAAALTSRGAQPTTPPSLIGERQDSLIQLTEEEALNDALSHAFLADAVIASGPVVGAGVADAGHGSGGAFEGAGWGGGHGGSGERGAHGGCSASADIFGMPTSDPLGSDSLLFDGQTSRPAPTQQHAMPLENANGSSLIDVQPSSDQDALASLFGTSGPPLGASSAQLAQASEGAVLSWDASLLSKPTQSLDGAGIDFGLLASSGAPSSTATPAEQGVFF